MLVRREKYYIKKINRISGFNYDTQKIKRVSFWFLGIIPVFIHHEVVDGKYEIF